MEPTDRRVLDDLFSAAYEELRRRALVVRGRERSLTLNPTVLVNEAWLKLAKSPGLVFESPLRFKRIAARAMRALDAVLDEFAQAEPRPTEMIQCRFGPVVSHPCR